MASRVFPNRESRSAFDIPLPVATVARVWDRMADSSESLDSMGSGGSLA